MGKVKRPNIGAASMADIARLANVSVASVSRALAGSPLVARERREKIVGIARKLGYVMNSQAQNLRLKRTQTISVVIPLGHESAQPLTDPFFSEMLGHLADEITQRNYGMFLMKVVPPMGDWLASLIASGKSDGIIVVGQSTEHKALEQASQGFQPMVVWGGAIPRQTYCCVGTDNVAGAKTAVEHLLRIGRRKIVFVGDPYVPELKLRYDGYLSALAGFKGASKPRVVPAHLMGESSYTAVQAFIDEHGEFDGIFAATDVIAISALRALTSAGFKVPQDVSVVGYDDIALASHANPPLTTVKQDFHAGAQTLVDLLFKRLNGERTSSVTLPTRLVVRESCGASLWKFGGPPSHATSLAARPTRK